jgi:hypothetical protein
MSTIALCESNALFETLFTCALSTIVGTSLVWNCTRRGHVMPTSNNVIRITLAGLCIIASCIGTCVVATSHRQFCSRLAQRSADSADQLAQLAQLVQLAQQGLNTSNWTLPVGAAPVTPPITITESQLDLCGFRSDQAQRLVFLFLWFALCMVYRPMQYGHVYRTPFDKHDTVVKDDHAVASVDKPSIVSSRAACTRSNQSVPTGVSVCVLIVVTMRHILFTAYDFSNAPTWYTQCGYVAWTIFMAFVLGACVVDRYYFIHRVRSHVYSVQNRPGIRPDARAHANWVAGCIDLDIAVGDVDQPANQQHHTHPVVSDHATNSFLTNRNRSTPGQENTLVYSRILTAGQQDSGTANPDPVPPRVSNQSDDIGDAHMNAIVYYDTAYLVLLLIFFNIETAFHFSRPIEDVVATLLHLNMVQLITACVYIVFTFIETTTP